MTLSLRSDTHAYRHSVYRDTRHIAIENYKIAKSLEPVKNSHQLTKGDSMLFKRIMCSHYNATYKKFTVAYYFLSGVLSLVVRTLCDAMANYSVIG